MGNRAIIKPESGDIGIYLHWNGGRDSVEGFLKYCELRGMRGFDDSESGYALARLTQVIANFFGGTTSIGIRHCKGTKEDAKYLDNSIYVVKGWDIVKRIYPGTSCAEQRVYGLQDMLLSIDAAQPEKEQLGKRFLNAEIIPTSNLNVGDRVYLHDYDGRYRIGKVIGFGGDGWVNGHKVKDVPYVDSYGDVDSYAENPNNYIFEKEVRLYEKAHSDELIDGAWEVANGEKE